MRHELLRPLFEKLRAEDRRLIGYTPRAGRAGRVTLVLKTAWDYLLSDEAEGREEALWDANMGDGPVVARVNSGRVGGEGEI